jgi:hypothetical protein
MFNDKNVFLALSQVDFLAGIFRALPQRLDTAIVNIIRLIDRAKPADIAGIAPNASSVTAASNVSVAFLEHCVEMIAMK